MNTWRDNKGAPASRTRGPLSVGDRRPSVGWVIGEVHHIAPDYERLRRPPVQPSPRRIPKLVWLFMAVCLAPFVAPLIGALGQ